MLFSPNFAEMPAESSRRALPNGYVVYDDLSPQIPIGSASIKCFLTKTDIDFQGDITYGKVGDTYSWNSKLPLDEGDYYVYGFMPANEANKITLTNRVGTDYSQGAVITIDGINTMSAYDICAIVGVKGSKSKLPISEIDLRNQLGVFEYNAENDGDYVYLLIDHLYAALHLRMMINSTYNQLRTIKLTKLSLKSKVKKTAQVVATFTANSSSPLSVNTTSSDNGEGAEVVIYDGEQKNEEKELKESETEMLDFLACTAALAENNQFVLKTKYNVYDKNGNLIRKGCEAMNTLSLPTNMTLNPGQKFVFNLTVNPTYLYVLSEPDLDNPVVTVTTTN